jgi:hypothetical protein
VCTEAFGSPCATLCPQAMATSLPPPQPAEPSPSCTPSSASRCSSSCWQTSASCSHAGSSLCGPSCAVFTTQAAAGRFGAPSQCRSVGYITQSVAHAPSGLPAHATVNDRKGRTRALSVKCRGVLNDTLAVRNELLTYLLRGTTALRGTSRR